MIAVPRGLNVASQIQSNPFSFFPFHYPFRNGGGEEDHLIHREEDLFLLFFFKRGIGFIGFPLSLSLVYLEKSTRGCWMEMIHQISSGSLLLLLFHSST